MDTRLKFMLLVAGMPLQKADVIFLAEGDGYNRVPYAVELYKRGLAPTIAIVGGDTRREYGSFLSGELKTELLKTGIPESVIHCEETGAHTKGEADRMMQLARERGWKSVLVLTSPHHQYRTFLTWLASMRQAGLDLTLVNAPAPLPWFASNPWGRRADLLEGEMKRIDEYQKKGDVASFEEGLAYLEKLESSI